MDLAIYKNGTWEEEKALWDCKFNKLIMKGDYYHDKIDEHIDGFLDGLSYCDVKFKVSHINLKPDNYRFEELDFYDGGND